MTKNTTPVKSSASSDTKPSVPPASKSSEDLQNTVSEALLDPKSIVKLTVHRIVGIFFQNPKVLAQVFVLVVALVVATRLVGYDPFFFIPVLKPVDTFLNGVPVASGASWVQETYSQQSCLTKAKELKRAYVLQHVVQYLDYEEDASVTPAVRRVHEKIFYTVIPLRAISSDEHIFLEEYSGAGMTAHWFGPRREAPEGGTQKYQVAFDAKAGQPVELVTGAEFTYPLPLADGRPAFQGRKTVNHEDDFWFYENIDDVICEFDQVVDSRTLRLSPIGRGGYRTDGTKDSENDVVYQPNPYAPAMNSALQSHWTLIIPGEDAGMIFHVAKPQ